MHEPILPARAVTRPVHHPARRALTRSFQDRPKGRNLLFQSTEGACMSRPGRSPPPPGSQTDKTCGCVSQPSTPLLEWWEAADDPILNEDKDRQPRKEHGASENRLTIGWIPSEGGVDALRHEEK